MIQTFEFHPIFVLSGNTVWLAKKDLVRNSAGVVILKHKE